MISFANEYRYCNNNFGIIIFGYSETFLWWTSFPLQLPELLFHRPLLLHPPSVFENIKIRHFGFIRTVTNRSRSPTERNTYRASSVSPLLVCRKSREMSYRFTSLQIFVWSRTAISSGRFLLHRYRYCNNSALIFNAGMFSQRRTVAGKERVIPFINVGIVHILREKLLHEKSSCTIILYATPLLTFFTRNTSSFFFRMRAVCSPSPENL